MSRIILGRLAVRVRSALVGLAAALLLASCASNVDIAAHLRPLPQDTMMLLGKKGMDAQAPIFISIFKEESELEIWKQRDDGHFYHFKTYPICNWSGDLGPKVRYGDRQAPEGFYTITREQMNPDSKYHLALNLGYPNAYDRSWKRDGDFLHDSHDTLQLRIALRRQRIGLHPRDDVLHLLLLLSTDRLFNSRAAFLVAARRSVIGLALTRIIHRARRVARDGRTFVERFVRRSILRQLRLPCLHRGLIPIESLGGDLERRTIERGFDQRGRPDAILRLLIDPTLRGALQNSKLRRRGRGHRAKRECEDSERPEGPKERRRTHEICSRWQGRRPGSAGSEITNQDARTRESERPV